MLATMSPKLSAETLADSNDELTMEIYRQSRISHTSAQARPKSLEISHFVSKLVGVNLFPNG